MEKPFIRLSAKLNNGTSIKAEKVTSTTSKFIVILDDSIIHEEICLNRNSLEVLLRLQAKYQ